MTFCINKDNKADVDDVAKHLVSLGASAKSLPPAWDGAQATSLVLAPNGVRIGHMLHGKGLLLDADLKDIGINKLLPNVFQRSPYARRVEALSKRWGNIIEKGPLFDPLTGALVDPERAAIKLIDKPILDKKWDGIPLSDTTLWEMSKIAAITSYDGIINGRATGLGVDVFIAKNSFTTTANDWYGMLRAAGTPTSMTLNATTAPTQTATNRTTTGAWSLGIPSPTGGRLKYLLTVGAFFGQTVNQFIIGDVHVQGGSFRVTVTTAETVASPVTITRQYFPLGPLGSGCYMIALTTTAVTTPAAATLTVTYVDQDNNAGQTTTVAFPATLTAAEQLAPDSSSAATPTPFWQLASGDYGHRSMSQTQFSIAHGAAGALAVLSFTPLIWMPGLAAQIYVERDSTVQIDGLVELVGTTTGCLNCLVQANTTSTGTAGFFMRTVEG